MPFAGVIELLLVVLVVAGIGAAAVSVFIVMWAKTDELLGGGATPQDPLE